MSPYAPLLQPLADVSARIGRDPLLVQGAGGNSSVKIDGVMWVKASGHWLAEAQDKPIFVPLALERVRGGGADDLGGAIVAERAPAGLRPSIETMMHALMPHAVVVHAHAVNSMTAAVLRDGRAHAAGRLADLAWAWIDYQRPGKPLADAIAAVLADGAPDILLLQNHGVVVGAATAEAAEALLREVEDRLAFPVRAFPIAAAHGGDAAEGYARDAALSGVADVPWLCDALGAAALLPDQVVFVGGAIPVCADGESVDGARARIERATGVRPAAIIRPGDGLYLARDISAGARSVVEGLLHVASRLPEGADISGLSRDDVGALLGWEEEHYRQALDRERR